MLCRTNWTLRRNDRPRFYRVSDTCPSSWVPHCNRTPKPQPEKYLHPTTLGDIRIHFRRKIQEFAARDEHPSHPPTFQRRSNTSREPVMIGQTISQILKLERNACPPALPSARPPKRSSLSFPITKPSRWEAPPERCAASTQPSTVSAPLAVCTCTAREIALGVHGRLAVKASIQLHCSSLKSVGHMARDIVQTVETAGQINRPAS